MSKKSNAKLRPFFNSIITFIRKTLQAPKEILTIWSMKYTKFCGTDYKYETRTLLKNYSLHFDYLFDFIVIFNQVYWLE